LFMGSRISGFGDIHQGDDRWIARITGRLFIP
jgi:hypothetical protein